MAALRVGRLLLLSALLPGRAVGLRAAASLRTQASAVVVLGQSLNPDRSPPETLIHRVKMACVAFQELPEARVVLTGGDPMQVGVTEAAVMDTLLRRGCQVSPALISQEDKARSTVQNALFSAEMLRDAGGVRRVTLVTSDFHMPRAAYTFEAVFAMPPNAGRFELALRPAQGGCADADAPEGANINEQSLAQRLRGEEEIIQHQMEAQELMSDLPDVHVPSPTAARFQEALGQVRAMMQAAGAAPA
mmetsp:Transcript_29182/g.86647  ORF Transcript_29182/g.86647 Transcript_29182/m.86647 type:complete len:247 (-) Transcript_29182:63-803(-)